MRPHIVIVGGGFAGLSALLTLRKSKAKITLVDANGFFEYLPALHLDLLKDHDKDIRLDLKRYYREFLLVDRVKTITDKEVVTDSRKIPFDFCVVATGSSTNCFGNKSFEQYARPVKCIADVDRSRDDIRKASSIAIIGAGYTGVEVASILAEDTDKTIHLIDGDAHVLHGVGNKAQKVAERHLQRDHVVFHLGTRVERCTENAVVLENGEQVKADVILLCAGISPNDDVLPDNHINPDLSVQGLPHVFAAGDAARTGVPATGHNAMLEGRHAAKNIRRLLAGEQTLPFEHPKHTLLGVALGHYWGVVPLGRFSWSSHAVGFLKWVIEQRILFEFKHRVMLPL